MKTYIYGLLDPDTKIIRYVGKSDCPKTRLSNHIQTSKKSKTHKSNWINLLIKNKKKPELVILEEVDFDDWEEREKYWINKYKNEGNDVTNFTNGGEGSEKIHFIDKDKLYQKYIIENLSLNKCASYFGVSGTTIYRNLAENNIKKDKSIWKKQCYNHEIDHKINRKIVLKYDLNLNLIVEFNGLKEAAKSVGKNTTASISACCIGKRLTSFNYIWKYKNDNIKLKDDYLENRYSFHNKKIYQYDIDVNFICEYKSLTDAINKTGIDIQISNKSSGGFIWKYEKSERVEKYTTNKKINPVIQLDLNGNFIAEYESMQKAAKLTNSNANGIYYSCIGKYKHSNNFIWKFK